MQSASDPTRLRESGNSDENDEKSAALNRQVASAVLKGLSYFGAGQVVESLVYILELEHAVDLNSLANNLDALRAALNKMFGGAAHVIEAKIAESLAKQLGVDPDGRKLDDLVQMLKEKIQDNSAKK
jgi:hypothetical protein